MDAIWSDDSRFKMVCLELANKNALMIVRELAAAGSASVADIAPKLNLTWQDVSLHLRRLQQVGLVEVQERVSALRGRKTRIYRISHLGVLLVPLDSRTGNEVGEGRKLVRSAIRALKDSAAVVSVALGFAVSLICFYLSARDIKNTFSSPSPMHLGIDSIVMIVAFGAMVFLFSRRKLFTKSH